MIERNLVRPHLQYTVDPAFTPMIRKMNDSLACLIDYAAKTDNKNLAEFNVLVVGSGRGELIQILARKGYQVEGIDIDPICVSMSSQYAPCRLGSVEDIYRLYRKQEFDIIVVSHVLEHLARPLDAVKSFRYISKKWILLAVPNAIRPLSIYKSVFRRQWSNAMHIVIWDHSHFNNFITLHSKLEIVREEHDYVEVFFGARSVMFKIGLLKYLNWIELRLLPFLFPHFSSSIIKLCRIPNGSLSN